MNNQQCKESGNSNPRLVSKSWLDQQHHYVMSELVHCSEHATAMSAISEQEPTIGTRVLARADRLVFERLVEWHVEPRRNGLGEFPMDKKTTASCDELLMALSKTSEKVSRLSQ